MLLAIDVGNTQTHIGMFRGEQLLEHWRLATDREDTADKLATTLANLLGLRDLRLRDVDAAIVSSVVPHLGHQYKAVSERYLAGALAVVGPDLKIGMPLRMDNPHEVGADRVVNSVAAYERCGGACIVADFGTSINYDVVSSGGEYLGGVLAPGVEISIDALAARAARLFKVDLDPPPNVIGKNTGAALQSGLIYGFAGQVDAIVSRIRSELGEVATAGATSGMAGPLVPLCEQIDEVEDLLP
ncbi:MAG: type III pantothenate kinase, partial [Solirubrobacteraceae bacterium]